MKEPTIHLVVQLYQPREPAVWRRMLTCLVRNAELACVGRISVVADGVAVALNHPKLVRVDLPRRATFADLLRVGQNAVEESGCTHLALANSDLFLSRDLEPLLARLTRPSSVAALTRHELNGELYANPKVSQDLWLMPRQRFSERLLQACEQQLGVAGCEHLFAMALYANGYDIWNPCLDCEVRHNDPQPRGVYSDRYFGAYLYLPPCRVSDVEHSAPAYEQELFRGPFQQGQPEPDPDAITLARWTGPLLTGQPPAMPDGVSGRVMNLDSAQERWQRMEAQLLQLGWQESHRRFVAQSASAEEARQLGLPSPGYLGLWRTTQAVLAEWLATEPAADALLHVMEDDAIFNPALPLVLEPLRRPELQLDVLFTEAFLTVPFYRRFRALERRRQQADGGLILLNGSQYLCCASSFVLTLRGATKLLRAMRQQEAIDRIPLNDMFYRQLIHQGVLRAAVTLPFFSTIEQAADSAVQTGLSDRLNLSKQVDLSLRRLLYLQSWEPAAASQILQELAHLLSLGLAPLQQEQLILDILSMGLGQGWLCSY